MFINIVNYNVCCFTDALLVYKFSETSETKTPLFGLLFLKVYMKAYVKFMLYVEGKYGLMTWLIVLETL